LRERDGTSTTGGCPFTTILLNWLRNGSELEQRGCDFSSVEYVKSVPQEWCFFLAFCRSPFSFLFSKFFSFLLS
jgi:hypothetical protein